MNSVSPLLRVLFVALILGSALAARAAGDVLKSLPPERFAKAGLQKLTPAELTELEQIIREATAGEIAAVASADRRNPGWLRALLTLQETGDRPEGADAIESRLVGDYDGWTGRTQFMLENGQIWQQAAPGERFDSKRTAPGVKIYPGMLGVYWLEVEGVRERVKVKPVKLQ